ncbi:ATP synthase epsilon chain [hydrothermal vent metagenome]|uniref:ATP synthase epsilon chain n=1 Tax=hydrothermal vent metagenome TaxID=652676 RepID=A0A3B0TY93_9ZZZZ
MAATITIEIVSPEHLVLSEEAQSVSVPGQEGYFTVMGEHAPLMTTLKPGFITVVAGSGTRTYYVQGGFADISPDGVTILAEVAKTGEDFDRSEIDAAILAAQAELEKAEGLHERDLAQNMLDGWKNLLLDAAQKTGASTH